MSLLETLTAESDAPTEKISLGFVPRPGQVELSDLASTYRFLVAVVHRRFGKTTWSIDRAVRCCVGPQARPAARYGYIAPLLKQAKMVAWDALKMHIEPLRRAGLVKINESELRVDFWNGTRIRLFGADNPDSIRGAYFDGVILDEVAQMPPSLWREVVRPMLADRMGWAVFIGTPAGINMFSQVYDFAQSEQGRTEGWAAYLRNVYETGVIPLEEIESLRASMPEREFRQEFLCDFGAANDGSLIKLEEVQKAMGRIAPEHMLEVLMGVPKIMGVDVARFGGDRSVITRRQGPVCFPQTKLQGLDNMELADHVAHQWIQWQPDLVNIDGGRGEGVIDRLRQLGFTPIEVHSGGRAQNERYANKRAEMWDRTRAWIADAYLPEDPELAADLCAPEYTFNKANRLQLERKEDMKKRGLRSPDLADSLCLTHAFDVSSSIISARRVVSAHGRPLNFNTDNHRARTEYDMFAEAL